MDLVIINQELTGYENPLNEQLRRLIEVSSYLTGMNQPGGIFLLTGDKIPEDDLILINSVSRANLIAARGPLRQQLVEPHDLIRYPPRFVARKRVEDEPSKPLPFLQLSLHNGIGGYSHDGKEYMIYLGSNEETPAPWINCLSNPQFGMIATEKGVATTWYGNSQTNRLTPWSNDALLNPIVDCLYIRDEDLGVFWSPTPSPIRELDPYRIRHGQGYSRYEHNSHNIEQDLLVFVPVNDAGGLPLRIQRLKIKNGSLKKRNLSIFSYSEWVLGKDREESQMHVITEWDLESQALFAYNRYHPNFSDHIAFISTNFPCKSYSGNRTEFLGRNGQTSKPAALIREKLSNSIGGGLDPCAALQIEMELKPGEEREVFFLLGYASNVNLARQMVLDAREPGWCERAFLETQAFWDKTLNSLQIETPDVSLNFSFNRWLLYQDLSCRYWGRSGFYQSSGAYGFRDQLQDVLALVYTAPQLTREHILRSASRQFIEGDVQHFWDPISNGGVRTRITDDLLWLTFATAHYVRVTNDLSILDEVIPFLKGDLLKENQEEAYNISEPSNESGSLLEHCRRAIFKATTAGPHGLPLIGSGDWNDGMNRVGIHGQGESIWLAWFIIHVLHDFADMLTLLDQNAAADGYSKEAKRLAQVIEETGWDGGWYRRAYFDDGTPLGSKSNTEDVIDILPQAWSIISGVADPERAKMALDAAYEYLVRPKERLVLLLTPAFDKTPLDPGYIKGYPPGVRENGGQYTHGSLWLPMAFARIGDGDRAVNLLQMMSAFSHSRNLQEVSQYKVEPYVLAADIYNLENRVGLGGWTWYTGSAGWMYRIWLEEIVGFKKRGDRLTLDPVLPKSWKNVKLQYRYKSSSYVFSIENPKQITKQKLFIEVDGQKIEGQEIQLVDDGKSHSVRVVYT